MSQTRHKRYTFLTDIRRNPLSYLMLIPAALYTLVFGYLTIPYMLSAFQNYNYRDGLFGSPYVGLKNFEFFFKSNAAPRVIGNTVFLNIMFITFTLIVSVTVALLLNELHHAKLKKFLQSTYLFYQSGVFDTGEYERTYEKSQMNKDFRGFTFLQESLWFVDHMRLLLHSMQSNRNASRLLNVSCRVVGYRARVSIIMLSFRRSRIELSIPLISISVFRASCATI